MDERYPLPPMPTLIVGGYGYRNAGDEAILAGLLTLTGREGVTVVSRNPADTARVHGVNAIGISAAPRALLRHRGLIIGGGGLFGRDMGLLGRLLPVAGLLAARSGRGVSLLGIGLDADMPRWTRPVVAALARRAVSVVVRDAASAAVLQSLGINGTVAPDLSSLVASGGSSGGIGLMLDAGLQPGRRPIVGLCLTAIRPELAEPVMTSVLAAVDALPGIDFCFLPMSRHRSVAAHDDAHFGERLIAARPRVRMLVPPHETSDLLAVFEGFSAAVCMRYHSLLFAERAGIPIIPFAYAEKCRHWLAERGMATLDPTPQAVTRALARLDMAAAA